MVEKTELTELLAKQAKLYEEKLSSTIMALKAEQDEKLFAAIMAVKAESKEHMQKEFENMIDQRITYFNKYN